MIFRGEDTVIVNIERPVMVKQDAGDLTTTWELFSTVYASKHLKRGSESFKSGQKQATQQTDFKIRYIAGISEQMRINHNGELYDITLVDEKQRDGYIRLEASAFPDRVQNNTIGVGQ
jgi:SPP1 family predicted phage head-tail adaptor